MRAKLSSNPQPRTDPVSEHPETHTEGHTGKKEVNTELELQVAASSTAETDQLRCKATEVETPRMSWARTVPASGREASAP